MADGHQGYGVPIGAVLPLREAVSQYAVGNDIGCGMALVPTTPARTDLLAPVPTPSGAGGPIARDDVMGWGADHGPGRHRHPGRPPGRRSRPAAGHRLGGDDAVREPERHTAHGQLVDPSRCRARAGARPVRGTWSRPSRHPLGSGNHFIELLAGPDGDVAVMLHSGSSGVGSFICNNFHRMALAHCAELGVVLPDPGLVGLPVPGGDDRWARIGQCYIAALQAALRCAELTGRGCSTTSAGSSNAASRVSCGATTPSTSTTTTPRSRTTTALMSGCTERAPSRRRKGHRRSFPGSMGTGSYLGRGRGNAESFASCSHGAGRALSRAAARRELSLQQQLAIVSAAGSKVYAANKAAVLDEMPGAYKDLDQVMRAQSDLVEPVRRFTPLATYKGSQEQRRKRRRQWRPEER